MNILRKYKCDDCTVIVLEESDLSKKVTFSKIRPKDFSLTLEELITDCAILNDLYDISTDLIKILSASSKSICMYTTLQFEYTSEKIFFVNDRPNTRGSVFLFLLKDSNEE